MPMRVDSFDFCFGRSRIHLITGDRVEVVGADGNVDYRNFDLDLLCLLLLLVNSSQDRMMYV